MEKPQSFRKPADAEFIKQSIQGEIDECKTVCSYLNQLEHEYGESRFAEKVYDYAECVEPTDPALGQDEELPRGMAFYDGCILGMRVAEDILGGNFLSKLNRVGVNFTSTEKYEEGSQEEADEIARQVCAFGEEGYNYYREYSDMIEELEDEISEVQYASYVRLGFGFLMRNVRAIEEKDAERAYQRDRQVFEVEVETMEHTSRAQVDEEWDAWLRDLTNNPQE